jgi:hypothetical protein
MVRIRVKRRFRKLVKRRRNRRAKVGRVSRLKGSPKVWPKTKKRRKSKLLKRINRFSKETISLKGKERIRVTLLFLRDFGV